MNLSRFCFIMSTLSLFGALWTMLMRIVPRDAFAWFVVIFSFLVMFSSAVYATVPRHSPSNDG